MTRQQGASASSVAFMHNDGMEVNDEIPAHSPTADCGRPTPEGWKNTYARADRALAEPFRGVTTEGQVVPGLFSLQQTGVSTRPIKDAADAFIASLTVAQVDQLGAISAPPWR